MNEYNESQQTQDPVQVHLPEQPPVQATRACRLVKESNLQTIELGGGDWVKIPTKFSAGFVEDYSSSSDEEKKDSHLLAKSIKEWNLLDENGQLLPINVDIVRQLSLEDMNTILDAILKAVGKVKKVPKDNGSK